MGYGEGWLLRQLEFSLLRLCLYFIRHCFQRYFLAGRTDTFTAFLFLIWAFYISMAGLQGQSEKKINYLTYVCCFGVVVHVTFENSFSFWRVAIDSTATHCHWPVIKLFTCDILS